MKFTWEATETEIIVISIRTLTGINLYTFIQATRTGILLVRTAFRLTANVASFIEYLASVIRAESAAMRL